MKNRYIITVAFAFLLMMISILISAYLAVGRREYVCDAVFFGDSIIACDHSERDLVTMLEKETGLDIVNGAFGGLTMSYIDDIHLVGNTDNLYTMRGLSEAVRDNDFSLQVVASQKENDYVMEYWYTTSMELDSIDWGNVQFIFIEHGTNDYLNGLQIENEEDLYDGYTFAGALRKSIENMQSGAPNAQIILVTPMYINPAGLPGDCYEIDYGGGLLEAYVNKEKEIASEYGLYVIDNFSELPFTKDNYEHYIPGGLHGSSEGNEIIAENIAKHLKGLDGFNK